MEPVTPKRPAYDLPKPETGLAEWTNRIKALQRQVDADEEAEHKRLEEEIAASRRARLRRSRGYSSRADSLDFSKSAEDLGIPQSKSPTSDIFKTTLDRQNDQDDALRRLTGRSSSPTIDASSITQGKLPRQSHYSTTQSPPQRQEPISLAAFIGGRATGPRLNRHAPQPDAHDPTQFEQREITKPHPVFGKGGVAMPGMVTKAGTTVRDAINASEAVERYQPRLGNRTSIPSLAQKKEEHPQPVSPQKSGSRDRTISTPAVTKKYLEQVGQRPVSPQKVKDRERTLSTPSQAASFKTVDHLASHSTNARSSNESSLDSPPKTPVNDRMPSRPSSERVNTPRQTSTIYNPLASPAKSVITTPSLARSIVPEPRLPSYSPIAPLGVVPSPAFQKPAAPKDPTPSISRLQGRGFVQSVVKASSQLQQSTSSSPTPSERKPVPRRKSSVLDRWQPNMNNSSSTPPPRQPSPVRKSTSGDVTAASPKVPTPKAASSVLPLAIQKSPSPTPATVLKSKASLPTLLHPDPLLPPEPPLSPRRAKLAEKMLPPEGSPGFGSATTMVVYKPKQSSAEKSTKPAPSQSAISTSSAPVDELGVKHSPDVKGKVRFSTPAELPPSAGKPLNHPTKDRARKPKKNRVSSQSEPNLETKEGTESALEYQATPVSHAPQPSDSSSAGLEKSDSRMPDTKSTERVPVSRVAHITQNWGQFAPIAVKPVTSTLIRSDFQPEVKAKTDPNLLRRALPGMTNGEELRSQQVAKEKTPSPESTFQVSSRSEPVPRTRETSPLDAADPPVSSNRAETRAISPNLPIKNERSPKSPASPRHSRIPSTGNRALVMDVAQALNEYNAGLPNDTQKPKTEDESKAGEMVPPTTEPGSTPKFNLAPSLERRRSSYDRFSIISPMPPLEEEATPSASPYGTVNRIPESLEHSKETSDKQSQDHLKNDVMHIDSNDALLPFVDVPSLLKARQPQSITSPDAQTISIEVFAINGLSATPISRDLDIFYDSEVLAIVHRYKSKASGLVSMQLWQWYGKSSHIGEKEERKLQELSKRYNTTFTVIRQNSEPPQLVHLLGGQLVIRQGNRSHWSAENTAMYSIRKLNNVVFIDEHELAVKNLCSAFSYCLTILDNVYVWHGCGSSDAERHAAQQYASRLGKDESSMIQLYEGENDTDELFWMALGDDEFAKADYWQWRRNSTITDPQIWCVDAKSETPVIPIHSFGAQSSIQESVYIIDCVWEYFVMVGSEARGERLSIRLALDVAERLAHLSAPSRPFTPTVHVLVLPSRLPLDFRLNIRELDEFALNNNDVPDHMNLLSSAQAENHLRQRSWEKTALKDQTMLPLGVSASGLH